MREEWSREFSQERFPGPISPLGWSLLEGPLFSTLQGLENTLGVRVPQPEKLITRKNAFIYHRKNFFGSMWSLNFSIKTLLKLFFAIVKSFLVRPNGESFWLRLSRIHFEPMANEVIGQWYKNRDQLLAQMRRPYTDHMRGSWTYIEYNNVVQEMKRDTHQFFLLDFPVFFLKNFFFKILEKYLDGKTLANLTTNLKGNISLRYLEDASLLQTDKSQWIKKYGHLTDDWDVYKPLLSEKLDPLAFKPAAIQKNQYQAKWPSYLNPVVRVFQSLVIIDEEMRFYSSLQYPEIKKLFNIVSQRFVDQKIITENGDVYFLFLGEIEALIQAPHPVQNLILERRREYENANVTKGTRTISVGKIVSPGDFSSGPVKVIRSVDDLRSLTGQEILVMEQPNPVYTPFFSQAKAIITETGSLLSHGAIVARELGVPMAVQMHGAFQTLKDGDRINFRKDGNNLHIQTENCL